MVINWHCFGSNGQETADYSKGVLERFMRRAPNDWYHMLGDKPVGGNPHVKSIHNPRRIRFLPQPHSAVYFNGFHAINENGNVVNGPFNIPITAEKIVINHYYCKSRKEYEMKRKRGRADILKKDVYRDSAFDTMDRNEEFDDGILKYRDERAKVYQSPDNSHVNERLLSALERTLSPILSEDTPQNFYAGKVETFLTCRAVSSYLKGKLADDSQAKFFEEAALKATLKALENSPSAADKELFKGELPKLLKLSYPVVEELRNLQTG